MWIRRRGKCDDQFFCPISNFSDFCTPYIFYHTFTNNLPDTTGHMIQLVASAMMRPDILSIKYHGKISGLNEHCKDSEKNPFIQT